MRDRRRRSFPFAAASVLLASAMQRGTSVALGAVFVAAVVALVWKGGKPTEPKPIAPAASASSAPIDAGIAALDASILDDPLFAEPIALTDAGASEGGRELPPGSPKQVRFGVVLVQYRGAQGAPAGMRSKDDALALARTLAEQAKTDFHGAVAKGDPGSTDDAGRMPRGMLEPETEYVLFTLDKGGTSDPIDTPRGYWIVRRSE